MERVMRLINKYSTIFLLTGLFLGVAFLSPGSIGNAEMAGPHQCPPMSVVIGVNGHSVTCAPLDTNLIEDGTINYDDIDTSMTLTSNSLPANKAWFGDSGIIFEGNADDAYEGKLYAGALDGDYSWKFPAVSGTVIVGTTNGDYVTGKIIAGGTITEWHIDNHESLGGNPNWTPNASFFGDQGILFEGATQDIYEGLLKANDPSVDTTWVLPDFSGNLVVENQPNVLFPAMIHASDGPSDEDCLTYEGNTGAFEWQGCGSSDANSPDFKAALIQALHDDPDFRNDVLAALLTH
jgi:hypothetical protein